MNKFCFVLFRFVSYSEMLSEDILNVNYFIRISFLHADIILRLFFSLTASSKCPGELEVCCRLPNNNTSTKLINPEHELDFRNIDEPRVNRMPYKPSCGQRNIKGVGVEITNLSDNSSSQFGEWPHVCAIVSHPGNQVSISPFVSKSCGLAVEHSAHDRKVVGLIPIQC